MNKPSLEDPSKYDFDDIYNQFYPEWDPPENFIRELIEKKRASIETHFEKKERKFIQILILSGILFVIKKLLDYSDLSPIVPFIFLILSIILVVYLILRIILMKEDFTEHNLCDRLLEHGKAIQVPVIFFQPHSIHSKGPIYTEYHLGYHYEYQNKYYRNTIILSESKIKKIGQKIHMPHLNAVLDPENPKDIIVDIYPDDPVYPEKPSYKIY